ncbi:hypothetical protein EJ110_NYTH21516 [Nymphaea thermarum]|nr:hypothetical protein EJ110_NYTH21516 [Nymphaea thermarum]
MALESLFTSIELEGGLVSTSKVEKLISLIQHDKASSCDDDLCRNWITIAKTLAITKSIDCLKLFIQLGGPKSLDRWLQEAQKDAISCSKKLVEELIIAVLDALKKLSLEKEELKACGIKKTIACFLAHENFEIQDRAKNLSAGWGNITNMNADQQEKNKGAVPLGCEYKFVNSLGENAEHLDCIKTTNSLTTEGATAEESRNTLTVQDAATNAVPHNEQRCGTHGLKTESSVCTTDCLTSITVDAQSSGPSDIPLVESSVPSNMPQKISVEEVISNIGSSANITGLGHDKISESEGNKLIDEHCSESEKSHFENDPLNLPLETSKKEQGDSSLPMSKTVISSSCPTDTIYSSHSAEKCDTNAEGKERISTLSMDYSDNEQKHNESQSAKLTEDSPDYWKRIMQQKPEKQNKVFLSSTPVMQNVDICHGKDGLRVSTEEVLTFREHVRKDSVVKSDINIKAVERVSAVEEKTSSILTLERENMEERDGKTLEMDLAYGVVDALEVARQVAKEVEEEVGIYREASCSSSSKMDMHGETIHPSTADSADIKRRSEVEREESCNECASLKSSHSSMEVDLEMASENEQSCSEGEEAPQEASGTMPEDDDQIHDQESLQLTTVPQESIHEKIHLGFDLNEDVQMEEGNCPEQSPGATACSFHVSTLPTPIAVVAASKGPVTGSASRLHFEGELGWRGTAATSAFRPAPSRRTPDNGNTCSIEENNYILKQSDLCSGIDLNVADGGDSVPMNFFADRNGRLDKHGQISLSLPSDDSSMEVSSKRAERLNLDLNHSGEVDESCQDLLSDRRSGYKMEQQQNESLITSAAPFRVPARNFDLNNPSFSDASHEPDFRKPSKMAKLDDSVVSIMGSRIRPGTNHLQAPNHIASGSQRHEYAVEHKQLLNEMQPYLVGAVPYISQMGKVVPVQPTLAFATQPAFPYSGMGLSLAMPPSSTSHSIGAVPCMLDARGTTNMPQMLGPGTFAAFPRPFFMGVVTGMQETDTNPSRPSLDLNATGSTSLDADSREGGGVRNRFFPGGGPVVEDQPRPFQVSVAGTSVKHKEPDCGWEPYQVGYKRT